MTTFFLSFSYYAQIQNPRRHAILTKMIETFEKMAKKPENSSLNIKTVHQKTISFPFYFDFVMSANGQKYIFLIVSKKEK